MSKERDIQILERKIAELEHKINKLQEQDAPNKKIESLEMKKLEYEDELVELETA